MSSSSGGSSGTTVSVNDNPTTTSGPSSITRPQEPPPPTPTQPPPSATETDGAIAIGSGTEDGNKRSSTVLMIPAKGAEDEEDGAGSKKVGIDNPGFQDEESSPTTAVGNGGSVFIAVSPTATTPTNNGAAFLNSSATVDTSMLTEVNLNNSTISGGSDSIEKKNKKEVTEAVNLELVNMNPFSTNIETNGIPVKKEGGDDVVLGDSYNDPYDEYFVPVNEHRKYMSTTEEDDEPRPPRSITFVLPPKDKGTGVDRSGLSVSPPLEGVVNYREWIQSTVRGEKLYVTKDKRRSQSWRRCVCWGVGFVILSVAILIAILAGTGVILSQEEQPIINENSVSSRQFSGNSNEPTAGGSLERDGVSSFSPPPFISTVPPMPPTTELSQLYVPRALEGEFVIDNLEFNPELATSQSEEFHKLASALEEELKMALFEAAYLKYGGTDIFVKVLEFSPGSVVVKFRVGWVLKKGITKIPDPIDIEHVRSRLEHHLSRSNGYLDTYHIPLGSIRANHFIDMCQFNQCSHGCTFDYQNTMDFLCTCPPSMFLSPNGKNCTDNFMMDVEEPHFFETEQPHFHEPASPSPEPEPEPEPVATEETYVTTSTAASMSSTTTTTTTTTTSTTTTTTPITTTTTSSSYEELLPETTPSPVIHSTESDYHILTPVSSTTENLQYKYYDEESEDYDNNHYPIPTIAPPLQHEYVSSTSSPAAEDEFPTEGVHILEETHTVVVGLTDGNVSKTEEPLPDVTASVQEDIDHDPESPNELLQQGVMLATEVPLNTTSSREENPIQYSILNHTESDNRENSVDMSTNQPNVLTPMEEEPALLPRVTTTEQILFTSERTSETAMPPLISEEQNDELFSNIDILDEHNNGSSTERMSVEHVPLNYYENTAEEPTYVAHNIETEKEHNDTSEDEINIPADFAPTTTIPESINKESQNSMHNDTMVTDNFQGAILGHNAEGMTGEENKTMISDTTALVHDERNHSAEGISFNELYPGSENDTILNSLSPEDYENHPLDNVYTSESNKTNVTNTVPQKRFRLNDDEMFMPNPEEEGLEFRSNETSSLDEYKPSVMSSTTEETHLNNEHEVIEEPSSNAATNTINDDSSLSEVNIAGNSTLENNENQTEPEDMIRQKDMVSVPEEITTEAIINDTSVSKEDTSLGELWKQVVLDGADDVHNDTESSSEHENITTTMVLLNSDENKNMALNETALPELKDDDNIMMVTTEAVQEIAVEEITSSDASDMSTLNNSVPTNATETSRENIQEVNELEHSNIISNNSSEENPIIAPPTVHEYNEARHFHDINDTHNAVEDNENVSKIMQIEEHPETTTAYSAVPNVVENSDLVNQSSKIMTIEGVPHHSNQNITVLETTEGIEDISVTTDNNEAKEQLTTLQPENDSEEGMQENALSLELMNNMNSTEITSSPANDLYEKDPENEVVDESNHNITNTEIMENTNANVSIAFNSLEGMKNKTELEMDSKEKYESNNVVTLDNATNLQTSIGNNTTIQYISENGTTTSETPMDIENEAEDDEDVFPGPLGINDFSGIQQFTPIAKPIQNNESYSFTEPTMIISSLKESTEKNLTSSPVTEKSVDEPQNSDIFKPILPPEFSGEDIENKLLVEPGVIHDQSTSSTTEIPNEIHALPSGGGNIIPPTSHSIALTDTKLEDVHHSPVTEHLSNDTSESNSSLTLPVESAEVQGASKETEGMESLSESVTKPENKKKDTQNISLYKKPVKPINDLGESDQSVPDKTTTILFDKKPIDKLQKFEKESNKKIDKMGLAALPVEDSLNEDESMTITTEGTEGDMHTNKTLESLPMPSNSTTDNTSVVELADHMNPVMEENSSLFGTQYTKEDSIRISEEENRRVNSSNYTPSNALFGINKEENQMENTSVDIPENNVPRENEENQNGSSNTSVPLLISPTESSSESTQNETAVQEDNTDSPTESTIDIRSFNVEPAISLSSNETDITEKVLNNSEPQPNISNTSIQNVVEESPYETSSVTTESSATISEMSTSIPSIEGNISNSSMQGPLITINDLIKLKENNPTNESLLLSSSTTTTTENPAVLLDIASGLTTDAVNGSVSTNISDDAMHTNSSENGTIQSIPNEAELPFPNIELVNNEDFPGTHKNQVLSLQEDNSTVSGSSLSEINNNYTTTTTVAPLEVRENLNISEASVFFSKCPAGHFQCLNGTSHDGAYCVSLSAKCDSVNDCSDGSDEMGCMEEGCPGNFQCSSGQCLKRHLVCNGIVDCNDGSDEIHCDEWKCQFDEFQCPSGRCIPVLWQCDGKPDCDNHTDEYNCQVSCGNDEYLCPERWCIPMTWRCNGVAECANGEDEKLCDCSLDQFRCNTGGCVHKSQVCDGVEHCPDMSDEWECVRLNNDTMHLQIRSSDGSWMSVCGDNWENELGNLACQNLGFSKAAFSVTAPSGTDGESFFQLKPGTVASLLNGNRRLPALLEKSKNGSTCTSGTRVEMSCVEFTCGSHGLADAVAARLVGGDGATNGQWPSVALLYHTRQNSSCTASIISPKWLLSSYNCLHLRDKSLNAESWIAYGGGSMFETDKPERQMREVRAIIPYPQVKYNQFLYNNDIALIELDQPLLFTPNVGAICLPDKEIEQRQICVMAGWGYTSPGQINFSQYLNYLPVPTIDLQECNSTKHYTGIITDDEICAGYTDAEKSPCYNDEGAPLMCASEGGVWELQGVLSYHSNCGRGYHPSIFSSITSVRDWIEKTVGSHFERKSTFNVRRR